ncbi:MAG: glycoside hydrolase family 127 protein [Thermoguttaceae bacterium]|nr:glycoside hydrolase family 127 protein [Thermoguttaceae bacterium]
MPKSIFALTLALIFVSTLALAREPNALPQRLESFPDLRADYDGPIGARVDSVVENWVERAPRANPAMLSVLQLRERAPKSSDYYVPWVGEFVGKYLENAILFLQTSDDPELRETVRAVVAALLACQDKDGYLGPYSKDERLRVRWDLWGHYHIMTALALYYERCGDASALEASRRIGLLFENLFYRADREGGELKVSDVGSDEVNFSIMTGLCQLYRLTGERHFLDAARKVLDDLQTKGDFYRQGLSGVEFYQTPQPRWESLHAIQGLEEFARIDGDPKFRRAFLNLWESVSKRDVHNNGSFSSGERAVGTPYQDAAIETCCTVAWIALTLDALRATGDSRKADSLENSLYNAVCAYEHPSGSWCSYNTPMNGRREASFHTIVFQSRPGQPELNCCSVNGPRGLAELVNWGVMRGSDVSGSPALYLNYYGAGTQTFSFKGKKFALTQKTRYPVDGRVELELGAEDGSEESFALNLRVPEWAEGATIQTSGADPTPVAPGAYATIERVWKRGETIVLDFPMNLRAVSGDGDFAGKCSVYYGPLLLAYDQFFNRFEPDAIPTLSPSALENAKIELVSPNPSAERVGFYSPSLFVKLDAGNEGAEPLFLVDFAFAGSLGTTAISWLPSRELPPPIPACDSPLQDARVAPGAIPFSWRKIVGAENIALKVVVSATEDFATPVFEALSADGKVALATSEQASALKPGETYYWKIVAENEFGTTESIAPGRRFRVDASLPPFDEDAWLNARAARRTRRVLIEDKLDGAANPTGGALLEAPSVEPGDGAVRFNGRDALIVYELEEFPRVEYEATLEFQADAVPEPGRIAQIISAWSKGMDDPLRVALDSEGRIYGAVEAPRGGTTPRVKIELGKRYRLRVVKEGDEFAVWLDDSPIGALAVEPVMSTESTKVALGGNPLFRVEPEFFNGSIWNFKLSGICEKP